MGNNTSLNQWIILFVALALLGILVWFTFDYLNQEAELSVKTWEGDWNVAYYYENEPQLLFEGILNLRVEDSIRGRLEIYPPKSKKPEVVKLGGLFFEENTLMISGYIVHDHYFINGGHNKEQFEFRLQTAKTFSGNGQCVAFCAEGTEDATIIWQGEREK